MSRSWPIVKCNAGIQRDIFLLQTEHAPVGPSLSRVVCEGIEYWVLFSIIQLLQGSKCPFAKKPILAHKKRAFAIFSSLWPKNMTWADLWSGKLESLKIASKLQRRVGQDSSTDLVRWADVVTAPCSSAPNYGYGSTRTVSEVQIRRLGGTGNLEELEQLWRIRWIRCIHGWLVLTCQIWLDLTLFGCHTASCSAKRPRVPPDHRTSKASSECMCFLFFLAQRMLAPCITCKSLLSNMYIWMYNIHMYMTVYDIHKYTHTWSMVYICCICCMPITYVDADARVECGCISLKFQKSSIWPCPCV